MLVIWNNCQWQYMLTSHVKMISDSSGFERFPWFDLCGWLQCDTELLKKDEFELRQCVAANMKGNCSGVQNKILDQNPLAIFMPYGCNNGNHAVCCGEMVFQSCNFVGLFGRLCRLFATSVNHWKILTQVFHHKVTEKNALWGKNCLSKSSQIRGCRCPWCIYHCCLERGKIRSQHCLELF